MSYLLAGRRSELERLQLQSRVWEPAGRALLERLGDGAGRRALDVGCGVMGWLRLLDEWADEVVGTDVEPGALAAAHDLVAAEGLTRTTVIEDDLFASRLEPESFDLVHARFQLAPLGRVREQLAAYRRWLRDGGTLVLEEPDSSSWRFNPPAPAAERLIELVRDAFAAGGGDFDAGRWLPDLARDLGADPAITAHVVALEPGHPYLRLPLQFATSLGLEELVELRSQAEDELGDPRRWGTTFTLIQVAVSVPLHR